MSSKKDTKERRSSKGSKKEEKKKENGSKSENSETLTDLLNNNKKTDKKERKDKKDKKDKKTSTTPKKEEKKEEKKVTTTTTTTPKEDSKKRKRTSSVDSSTNEQTKKFKFGEATSTSSSTPSKGGAGAPSKEIVISESDEAVPVTKFRVSTKTVEVLAKNGITTLFPIQAQSFDHVFAGKDMVGKARTGTGKTLSFSLPIVERMLLEREQQKKEGTVPRVPAPRAIILAPTRELAIQVEKVVSMLCRNELTSLCVYGGTEMRAQAWALRKGVDIVVGTAGRVTDFMESGTLKLNEVKYFVCDEADRMLDMGFLPSVQGIVASIPKENNAQTLFYSATMPPAIRSIVRNHLKRDYVTIDLFSNQSQQTALTVRHLAMRINFHAAKDVIKSVIDTYGNSGKTIIFCKTKAEVNELSISSAISPISQPIHGDIQQAQREKTLHGFRTGSFNVLIATDVAARGLDIEGVDLVIQMFPEIPDDIEGYVHRSGRTGRAGKPGTCISFVKNLAGISFLKAKLNTPIKLIGPPQPQDLIKASVSTAIESICSVQTGQVTNFLDFAADLLERYKVLRKTNELHQVEKIKAILESQASQNEDEDEEEEEEEEEDEVEDEELPEVGSKDLEEDNHMTLELLARALAVITGHTSQTQRMSLLSCDVGYTTMKITSTRPPVAISNLHSAIRAVIGGETHNALKFWKATPKGTLLADITSEVADQLLTSDKKAGAYSYISFELATPADLEDIADADIGAGGGRGGRRGGNRGGGSWRGDRDGGSRGGSRGGGRGGDRGGDRGGYRGGDRGGSRGGGRGGRGRGGY